MASIRVGVRTLADASGSPETLRRSFHLALLHALFDTSRAVLDDMGERSQSLCEEASEAEKR